eukprot:gene33398-40405_t
MEIAEGIPADHEARYMDYIQTDQGKVVYTVLLLLRLYQFVLRQIVAKLEKMRRKPATKSEKHAIAENGVNDLTPIYHNICIESEVDNSVSAAERNKQWLIIKPRNFEEELKGAKKLLSKTELCMVEVEVHAELCEALKRRTIETARISIAQGQEERRKDYSAKELDISVNYGSRITRWEYVMNKKTSKFYYVNVDTLELRHPKTAICEECDAFFVQHELRCGNCNAPRSSKNLLLYRPMGFKDITLE